jgi:hypothetical protein
MKRLVAPFVLAVLAALASPAGALGDSGNAPPTLSFFSGGGGAFAGWLQTSDQPPGDTDRQAIQIHDTTAPTGYAGVLVHHVYGIPTATFPDSSFDFKSSVASPSSLGYPRLVIIFSDGGNASLRPLTWTTSWQQGVTSPNWDNNAGGCGFLFQTTWQAIQNCHPGTFVTNAFVTTDPGIDVTFLLDNLTVDGKRFTSAKDNADGDNTTATDTPDLLPPL